MSSEIWPKTALYYGFTHSWPGKFHKPQDIRENCEDFLHGNISCFTVCKVHLTFCPNKWKKIHAIWFHDQVLLGLFPFKVLSIPFCLDLWLHCIHKRVLLASRNSSSRTWHRSDSRIWETRGLEGWQATQPIQVHWCLCMEFQSKLYCILNSWSHF